MSADIIAPQSAAIVPEKFQADLIANLAAALLRVNAPPCLLRAPTGSGKTFIITKVLQEVTQSSPTIWFWFVPFINLIQQTEDSLAANANTLTPVSLMRGRNQLPTRGQVIISTAQSVAKGKSRTEGYTDGSDDTTRSIDSLVALARVNRLQIGLVVDEAHIALDTQTEFGKFAKWLKPNRIIMASATPKDARLIQFIQNAGYSAYETFNVSRYDVVQARLNKRYIEAVVYDLRQSLQTVTDLQQTVLKQAWRQNMRLKARLAENGTNLVPLLLVQVANGKGTVEAARDQLMRLCKIPPAAIGIHSADDPDPLLMASIANDTSKEVLIFKQSAGTGFDAPRAFVLASTKAVNDPDFAAQFIGRVMRVHRSIRAQYPRGSVIDKVLDTAYIYLANAEAQQGFEQAVAATANLQSELTGQTEKLVPRKMKSGAVVYTNHPAEMDDLFYDLSFPSSERKAPAQQDTAWVTSGRTPTLDGLEFAPDDDELDTMEAQPAPAKFTRGAGTSSSGQKADTSPTKPDRAKFIAAMSQAGIKLYSRRQNVNALPVAFKAEQKPEMENMAAASKAAATRLNIDSDLKRNAILIALDRARDLEIHTELTEGERTENKVAIVIDRAALAAEAYSALKALPQIEEADAAIIVDVISRRLRDDIASAIEDEDRDSPTDIELTRLSRHAAYAVIRKERDALAELLYEEIADQAKIVDTGTVPDAMIFAIDLPLEGSTKNIYGVLPPSKDDVTKLGSVLTVDQRSLLEERHAELEDGRLHYAPYDGSWALGHDERLFAKALDRSDFVHWWHRNPDRKSFSLRLVRMEHKNYFYPDFIVCLEHFPGDDPLVRLVETKESVKDAARKAKRESPLYGKVLFITKDIQKWRWIKEDGTLGSEIDLDNLRALQDWMRSTVPISRSS
jgi:type III restriction enzyme